MENPSSSMKIIERVPSIGAAVSGTCRSFTEDIWFPATAWLTTTSTKSSGGSGRARSSLLAALLFFVFLSVAVFFSARFLDFSSGRTAIGSITGISSQKSMFGSPKRPAGNLDKNKTQLHLNCVPAADVTKQCPSSRYYPANYTARTENQSPKQQEDQQPTCPDYFRWIHEDLWPWRDTGITAEMVEAARSRISADFRLTIVNGTAYLQTFKRSYQTRDIFTQWGILQLLRLYPGRIPDLDLIFNCGDRPSVPKETYPKPDAQAPPPTFSYDVSDDTTDIVFPDWSFWGWIEINIKPWETLSKELKAGNKKRKWKKREPHAYWKGNPHVSGIRMDLLKCNVSDQHDWNARIYAQDWYRETKQGFKDSNLANQCQHRYKIYIEGVAWSVSQKYILACDSLTLQVRPHFYDFFSRSLMPLQHYWPIKDDDKCRSIKHAVDWGNAHQKEAQAIGKAGSEFVQEELQMRYVYDYMFHLLTEYSKLLTYKPVVPPGAVELCWESMACPADGLMKKYMMDTLVTSPSVSPPCNMPPPHDPAARHSFLQRKKSSIKQVEMWENQYWDTLDKKIH